MNQFIKFFVFFISLVATSQVFAFKNKAYSVGIGYYSQNFLNKTSQSASGASALQGEPNYPFNFKYDFALSPNWFLAPQLGYTLLPRNTAGSTAKVSLMHLSFLFGKNFQGSGSNWDWFVGPGIIQEDIKGNGGTVVMNNGTSTATFALPGKNSTVRKITLNMGGSWMIGPSRLGLELIFENAFSNSKRTQSLMFSYSYVFSGGTKAVGARK